MFSYFDRLYLLQEDGGFYLHAECVHETERYKKRIIIPKILLPISDDFVIKTPTHYYDRGTINIGFGNVPLMRGEVFYKGDHHEDVYAVEYIEEDKKPTKKMTLSEIERKLGYKIELISEEE